MNEHQLIQLREFQQLKDVRLSKSVAEGLQQKYTNILHITPTMDEDIYHVTGKSFVGVIEYNEITIQIKPKMDIPMIWDWLTLAYDLKSLQLIDSKIGFEELFGSLDWVVKHFLMECKQIYSRGVKKGYSTQEEAIKAIRGQWLPNKTFYRWLKHDYLFDCRFDEITENVIENQIIAATLKDMMSGKYYDSNILKTCKELFNLFGKAIDSQEINQRSTPTKRIQELDRIPRTRLNVYYHDAFKWARMYWKAISLSFELGNTKSNTFMLDMNELFELYVGKSLQHELKAFGMNVFLQKFDNLAENGKIRIIPDVIVKAPSGEEIIIDMKYIIRRDESSINSNIFQMLAYLTARQADHGILLYAGGTERIDMIKNSNFTIHQWSLNLDKPKIDIKSRIKEVIKRLIILIEGK